MSEEKSEKPTNEEMLRMIHEAVDAGRVCFCGAVGGDDKPLNIVCPMHPGGLQ